jgi:methionine sulfoxide reductase heme-binding subunit
MGSGPIINGWRLYWVLTLALGLMTAACLGAAGTGPDGIRLVIRATARTSLFLFLIAFAAGALAQLWPGPLTRWMRTNRRQFGLGFATSHFAHAVVIIALATTAPAIFWSLTNRVSIVTGGIAYVFIGLLAVTSFNATATMLGPTAWRRLHGWGVWVIAVSFIFTNAKRIPVSGWYAVPTAIVIGVVILRFIANRASRRTAIS